MNHSRTITYLKAVWPTSNRTLQDVLDIAWRAIPSFGNSVVALGQGEAKVKNWTTRQGLLFIHIAAWTEGQKAAVVSHADEALSVVGAGENRDFATRSGMILVHGNNCLFVSGFNMTPGSMKRYLYNLIVKAIGMSDSALSDSDTLFNILPVEDRSKSQELFRSGNVKHLELDVASQNTRAYEGVNSLRSKFASALGMFHKDMNEEQLEQLASMNRKLIISPGRGKHKLTYEVMTDIARRVIDEGDEDYLSFVTADGSKVSPAGLVLRKRVSVLAEGNSVNYRKAWNALYSYYKELSDGGLLAR